MARRNKKRDGDLIISIAIFIGLLVYGTDVTGAFLSALKYALTIAGLGLLAYFLIFRKAKIPATTKKTAIIHGSPAHTAPEKDLYPLCKDDTFSENINAKPPPTDWTPELINSLEWKRFEELCAGYFAEKGYRTQLTRQGADGGIDINLFKESYSTSKPFGVVQCKAWNNYKVGVKQIRELYGVMAAEEAPLGIFVTSGKYTTEAEAFSDGKHLILLTGEKLLKRLKKLPEEKSQALLAKITKGDYMTPTCPSCGIKMVVRVSKNPSNVGSKFWGCSNYPKCRNTLKLGKSREQNG